MATYFNLLGPFELYNGARPVLLTPASRRLLVGLYLCQLVGGRRATLSFRDLGFRTDGTMRSQLRNLRQQLDKEWCVADGPTPEVIVERGRGCRIDVSGVEVDRDRFLQLVVAGEQSVRNGGHARAQAALSEAIGLWRGEPMPEADDLTRFHSTVQAEVCRLSGRRDDARIRLVIACEALHRDVEAVEVAEQQIAESTPTLSAFWESWARAEARTHGVARAADVCRRGMQVLLGVPTSDEALRELQRRILNEDPELMPRPAGNRILGAPPQFDGEFVGRHAELAAMRRALSRRDRQPPAVALHGGSGMGKSRLAVEFWQRSEPPSRLVWVPAGSAVSVRTTALNRAREFGVPVTVPDDDAVDYFWQRLDADGPWILVFDGAVKLDAISELWPRQAVNCEVIVTSAHAGWDDWADMCPVTPLTEPDAIRYLAQFYASGQVAELALVARRLRCVPGVLHAAATSFRSGSTPRDYLELLVTELGERDDSLDVAAWIPMIDELDEAEPAAAQLADLLAVLGEADLPLAVLRNGWDRLPDPLSSILGDEARLRDVFAALARCLSVTVAPELLGGLHALARSAIVLRQRRNGEHEFWARTATALLEAAVTEIEYGEFSPYAAQLYEHAAAVAGVAREDGAGQQQAVANLLIFAGDQAAIAGDMVQSINCYTLALGTHQSAARPGAHDDAPVLLKLGLRMRDRGDERTARDVFEQVIRGGVGAERAPSVASALAGKAIVLFDEGDFAEANRTLDEAVALDVPDVQMAILSVRALVCWRLHELDRAYACSVEVVKLNAIRFGTRGTAYATALDNLSKIVLDQGRPLLAVPLARRGRDLRADVLGVGHPNTALSEYHLARALRYRDGIGDLREARELCVHALQVCRRRHGEKHSHVGRCLAELGMTELRIAEQTGARPVSAVNRLDDARSVLIQSRGLRHYETALCEAQYAEALLAVGNVQAARGAALRSLDVLRSCHEFAASHPYLTGPLRVLEATGGR